MMKRLSYIMLTALMVSSASVSAGVVMGGTRIVYPQHSKEVAFSVSNMESAVPYLIQSWVEGDGQDKNNAAPFIVTPPLFRLDPEQTNTLRIQYTGAPLPTDRESVFWLDIKAIASKPKESSNELQVNVKSKFKIFYRPDNLKGDAATAWQKITFSRTGKGLKAANPTPYYVSFYRLSVGGHKIEQPGMIGPGEIREWPVSASGGVSWSAINDFGAITATHTQPL
ncbi:MAG: molecular chaperone [Enterobacter hormaechei]|uniref:fimbrial biogenesis chaperone n=1 Tax=Enterobacter cloacae complex TaxID=354276 RepID=UPI0005EFDA17|nr:MULTISPECIES: molecular chaperone [Enterobacter cloacae complex]HCJ6262954.1 molecular chaperone [Enterobacter hormaechei subsp. xiangfangensis]EHF4926636.1 molecular chaperone [Enterobacter hormaechei]EHF5033042.1 molecular chaperone [Enterobacter hormaechei]EKK5523013.1 molecular chaperone [Enterobacter hormaechei]EKS6323011.1 molecular chaperone [Enterobacter hormaechei]